MDMCYDIEFHGHASDVCLQSRIRGCGEGNPGERRRRASHRQGELAVMTADNGTFFIVLFVDGIEWGYSVEQSLQQRQARNSSPDYQRRGKCPNRQGNAKHVFAFDNSVIDCVWMDAVAVLSGSGDRERRD